MSIVSTTPSFGIRDITLELIEEAINPVEKDLLAAPKEMYMNEVSLHKKELPHETTLIGTRRWI